MNNKYIVIKNKEELEKALLILHYYKKRVPYVLNEWKKFPGFLYFCGDNLSYIHDREDGITLNLFKRYHIEELKYANLLEM